MLSGNGLLFVFLQFGSRFANSFLTTAARYELLESGSVARFASAQAATSVLRMFVSQVSGLLTDNLALKHMYVGVEGCNLIFSALMLAPVLDRNVILFGANLGLGLLFAFSQPLTKSMPPAVTTSESDLALINGWDLTCDKIGRYLAPMAYAVVSSSLGFRFAVMFSLVFYTVLTLLRTKVAVDESARKAQALKKPPSSSGSSISSRLFGVLTQILDGIISLRRDSALRLLILNTLLTNLFVYPVNSVVFPVLLKQITEGPGSGNSSTIIGQTLESVMNALGIRKKKAWMNYTALISLGGVVGPFLSTFMIYGIEQFAASRRLWVGLYVGILGQILCGVLLGLLLATGTGFDLSLLVLLLALTWVVIIATNNIVTTYFNSLSQQRLHQGERGRFIANIMAVFTLGNSMGVMLFSWGEVTDVFVSIRLLMCGVALKVVILVLLSREQNAIQVKVIPTETKDE